MMRRWVFIVIFLYIFPINCFPKRIPVEIVNDARLCAQFEGTSLRSWNFWLTVSSGLFVPITNSVNMLFARYLISLNFIKAFTSQIDQVQSLSVRAAQELGLMILDTILGILSNHSLSEFLTYFEFMKVDNMVFPRLEDYLAQADGLDALAGTGIHHGLYFAIPITLPDGTSLARNWDYYKKYNMIDLQFENIRNMDDFLEPICEALKVSSFELFSKAKESLLACEAKAFNAKNEIIYHLHNVIEEIREQTGRVFIEQHKLNLSKKNQEREVKKELSLPTEKNSISSVSNYLMNIKYKI